MKTFYRNMTLHAARHIAQILLGTGGINAPDVKRAAPERPSTPSTIMTHNHSRLSTRERLLEVQRLQKEQGLRFGEAALKLQWISEEDIQPAVAEQYGYHYPNLEQGHFNESLIAAYHPFSPRMETLRSIRTQLMLRLQAKARTSLAIVSPERGDGRSFVASNLAVTFSQLGQTLLIDTDLRQPSQHTIFGLSCNGLGLSDILAGRADRESIRRISNFRNLSVLPAGTLPSDSLELLGCYRLRDLLRDLESEFDVILMDTTAASSSADVQSVAAWAGAAMLLTRRNQTRLAAAKALQHALRTAQCELFGAVVNEL